MTSSEQLIAADRAATIAERAARDAHAAMLALSVGTAKLVEALDSGTIEQTHRAAVAAATGAADRVDTVEHLAAAVARQSRHTRHALHESGTDVRGNAVEDVGLAFGAASKAEEHAHRACTHLSAAAWRAARTVTEGYGIDSDWAGRHAKEADAAVSEALALTARVAHLLDIATSTLATELVSGGGDYATADDLAALTGG